MRSDWPRGQAARDEAACEPLATWRKFKLPKEKWDSTPLTDDRADSDETMRAFTITTPANIDMSITEDRELVQLVSLHVADGSLYEAQPGVFKYTPQGIEKKKREVISARRNRLEMERMSRN
jgi:hypothetical protein